MKRNASVRVGSKNFSLPKVGQLEKEERKILSLNVVP
jgi:hypothetical protein